MARDFFLFNSSVDYFDSGSATSQQIGYIEKSQYKPKSLRGCSVPLAASLFVVSGMRG